MFYRHGSLAVAMVIVLSLLSIRQGVLAPQVPPVAFQTPKCSGLYVELASNLTLSEFPQVVHIHCAQELTQYINSERVVALLEESLHHHQLLNGQRINLVDENEKWSIDFGFMSAQRRVTLGIPLHPDQMSETDWIMLPGVGEHLAKKIVENQKEFGSFGTYQALARVKGIGSKSLVRWGELF